MDLLGLLILLGFLGGLLTGLVGLGGGIILAPLLLYIPPMLGLDNFGMKEVARLTIIQSLCSTAAAGCAHHHARLVQVLRIPMRMAIGSSLAITFCAALAGSFGKLAGGGQVVWLHVGALAAGSILGSPLGTALSCRLPVLYLRYGLAILVAVAAARMWYEVMT